MKSNAVSTGAREDTDTPNVNDTSEHVAPLSLSLSLSPSFFLSLVRSEPPLEISLTLRSTLCDLRTPKLHFRYFRVCRDESLANERERTDGRAATSLSLSSERTSAVPRERNGTARYGTVRYGTRGPGHHHTGSPLLRLRKEKYIKAGLWGTRAQATTCRENFQPFGFPSFPRESDLGVRLCGKCGNHRHAGDVYRCVTDFFPPWRDTGWGAGTYDGTAICCNGGAPLGFVEERVFRDGSMSLKAWCWEIKMAPSFGEKKI